jgi:hypothetical protein
LVWDNLRGGKNTNYYVAIGRSWSSTRVFSPTQVRRKTMPVLVSASCLRLLVFLYFISKESWIAGVAGLGLGVAYYLLQKWIELAALKERLSFKKQTVRERVLTFENDL